MPANVFGVPQASLAYCGRVTKVSAKGKVTVHFASDKTTFWFPQEEAQAWQV